MAEYKSRRIVGWVVVNENGEITNRNPSKDELIKFSMEPYKHGNARKYKKYTNEQLLWYLMQFYKKYGRPPGRRDFINNSEYPDYQNYKTRFGSWSNALKLVGLDVDSMIRKGIIENEYQKGRFGEILIRDHFEKNSTDLAGENCNSPCDGICPNRMTYDVKSSKLYVGRYYYFGTDNKCKDDIEIFYLLGFNEDYTKLDYGWRIPGEIVESSRFYVGLNDCSRAKFTVDDMKQYDITEKLRDVLNKYGYFEKIKNYRKAKEKGLTIYEYDKQLYDGCIVTESDIIKICQNLK